MGITNKTISALQGLPFDNLIGGPLNACVAAQADAAQSTINFINQVGLNEDEDGKKEAIYVYFTFIQNGRKSILSVPLLTIVPIPYIGINTIDINFKATISGVESSSFTNSLSQEYTEEKTSTKKRGLIRRKTTSLKSTFSSKKDSTSTKDSTFSIEATVDVAVHASQDSMPAGMAKILEMLGGSLDVVDPYGELAVNDTVFYINTAKDAAEAEKTALLTAQFKSPDGLYTIEGIACKKSGGSAITPVPGSTRALSLSYKLTEPGIYTVTAGDNAIDIEVKSV